MSTPVCITTVLASGLNFFIIFLSLSVKTITDLTKLLGRNGFNEIVGPFVVKPPGKPTLAPLSDPRKPMELNTVTAEDFDQALKKVNDVLENMYRHAPSAKDEIHLKDPELEELCIERF